MEILRGIDRTDAYRGGFLSIGNFDGVHRGHQQMFASLARCAREQNVPSVVFTFEPHPIQLLRPQAVPPALTSLDQKASLIEVAEIDFLIIYPTDLRLLNLSPAEFFETIVRSEIDAIGMVEGPNFFFGHNRSGTVETLATLCSQSGLKLEIVPPVFVGTQMVSSSVIRALIADGQVSDAADLLGHRYRLQGRVSKGSERGRTIGFPTANLTNLVTVLPLDGVYAGIARCGDQTHAAAINIGPNPTFGEHRRKVEAHLLDFEGDLYDQPISLDFICRIRDTRPFADVESLKTQLAEDIEQVRAVVRTSSIR